ncbi:MAG: hypothetical protein JWN00_4444 [Actinomycetia bacterium]|jgi:ATP synthase protein I|nr:hypothetical protein [Actinomycetes bacterium]
METLDARILRGAAIPTALAGAVAAVIGFLVTGPKGALGAVIGLVVVIVFFSISVLVVGYIGRRAPQLLLMAGVLSYALKLIILFVLIAAFKHQTIWNPKAFAFTVVALTVVWLMSETRVTLAGRTPYVVPGSGSAGNPDTRLGRDA